MTSRQTGFTLIELLITITIMVILMSLAIISLRNSQANARDAKRASDITTIARGLEQRYINGFETSSDGTYMSLARKVYFGGTWTTFCGSSAPVLQPGSYPTTEELSYAQGTNDTAFCPDQAPTTYLYDDLPGTSDSTFKAPNGGVLKMATTSTVPISLAANDTNYYYQPLDDTNTLCTTTSSLAKPCVKFNLYYVGETTGLQTITSKHQQ